MLARARTYQPGGTSDCLTFSIFDIPVARGVLGRATTTKGGGEGEGCVATLFTIFVVLSLSLSLSLSLFLFALPPLGRWDVRSMYWGGVQAAGSTAPVASVPKVSVHISNQVH
jgi:hypothetical protein